MSTQPPSHILIGTDEDKDKVIAKLKANLEEEEKNAKKAMDEKEHMEAKLKALEETTPGPVVKAMSAGMDEDHKEEAKKALLKAADDEDNPFKKASLVKAAEDIFDKGNGTNTNSAKVAQDEEEEKTATMKALTARAAEPTIKKMLSARQVMGADPDDLAIEKKRLSALTLTQLDSEYKSQEIFITQALQASVIVETPEHALTAGMEKEMPFNGAGALTGKTIDLDAVIAEATA